MGKLENYDFLKGNTFSLKFSDDEFLKWYKKGLNDTEIAKKLNCNHVTIHKKRQKYNLPKNFKYKSKIVISTLKDMYNQGKSDVEIAKVFNLNSKWIGDKRRELNLPTKYDKRINRTLGTLSFEEEQTLIGTVLGDTHLRKEFENGGTGGMFAHSDKQKEYCYWKYDILKRFCLKEPIFKSQYHKIRKKTYYKYIVNFKVDTIFNEYYNLFYKNKIKVINNDLLNKLEPLGLAVWFMDDGYKQKSSGGYALSTNCFSQNEIELIQSLLLNKWGIYTSIHNKNVKNRRILYIKKKTAYKFKDLIEKYIHPTLLYKLH